MVQRHAFQGVTKRSQIPGWAPMAAGSGVPRPGAGVRAADRDGPLGLRVDSQDVDAAGVAYRERGDEARAGELSRDEVFACDTGKLGAGFHVWAFYCWEECSGFTLKFPKKAE